MNETIARSALQEGTSSGSSFAAQLRERRKRLRLYSHPIKTTSLSLRKMRCLLCKLLVWCKTHRARFSKVLLPVVIVWGLLRILPGRHRAIQDEIWLNLSLTIWWVGLGVLSSVGLGTGMHSGLLFLFPHIYVVCKTAELCGSLDFDSRTNMWERHLEPGSFFDCVSQVSLATPVTFWKITSKCWGVCLLWGFGTAIGELPPYAASYAAAKAREEDDMFEQLEHEISDGSRRNSLLVASKKWMVEFLQHHGFIGVLLLSSWPNALFDLCGICCGHFLMPFWSFLLAVSLGKGLIKVTGQLLFFIFVFSEVFAETRKNLIFAIAPAVRWVSMGVIHEEYIAKKLQDIVNSIEIGGNKASSKQQSWLSSAFGFFIFIVILYFVVTCIEQLAQQQQKEFDEEELHMKFPPKVSASPSDATAASGSTIYALRQRVPTSITT